MKYMERRYVEKVSTSPALPAFFVQKTNTFRKK